MGRYKRISLKCGLIFATVIFVLNWAFQDRTPSFVQHEMKHDQRYVTFDELPAAGINRSYCEKVIRGKFENLQTHSSLLDMYPDRQKYVESLNDCVEVLQGRRYLRKPVNQKEASFPLAFSILAYKDAQQLENLLSLIYRPQNIYCIYIDRKSAEELFLSMRKLGRCLPNVIVESRRFTVTWGFESVLRAELQCMRTLVQRHKKWKYFINLTGTLCSHTYRK